MLKIAILFGGKSFEHEVSIKSASNVYDNLDKTKYLVSLIYLDKENKLYKTNDFSLKKLELIDNISILKKYDVVFPVMHGNFGEDGKLQGLLDMLNIKYVGCNLITSAICMDKVYTKMILDKASIPNAKYIYCLKDYDYESIKKEVLTKINYPCFIKPANAGSSVGISKCKEEKDLKLCLDEALKYDSKVLIEKYIKGKEVEIAILGNKDLIISNIGEIFSADDFYTYDAKYNNDKSFVKVLTDIDENISDIIKKYALKAYQKLGCNSLARIDFFIEETGQVYLNEINTMPGFTNISMYPLLMNEIGISYKVLLDKLISISLE